MGPGDWVAPMRGSGDRRLFLGCALAAVVTVTAGCGGNASDAATRPDPPLTPVQVETLAPRQFITALVVPGIVEPDTRISLGFRIDGFLARMNVDEGDRVEAGQVIAVLDLADLEREVRVARVGVDQATARAAEAKLLFDRQQGLFDGHNTSQQAYDQARLAWDAARAEQASAGLRLEAAEDRLHKGTLRAPISGHVERRLLEAHEPAQAGQPVFVLANIDTVTVRAAVADTAISRLHVGGAAEVRTAAWPDRTFAGTISRIHVAADPTTRTCPFELHVANADGALMPETVVEVNVALEQSAPALTLPLEAVLRDSAAQPFCYALVRDDDRDRVARRLVTLGPVHGDRVTIETGLVAGDRVVTRGQHFLAEGDPVRIAAD